MIMSALRASIVFLTGDPDLTVVAIKCRRFAPSNPRRFVRCMVLTREAGVSIKPAVERSGTPGTVVEKYSKPAERATALNVNSVARSAGSIVVGVLVPGAYTQALCWRALRALTRSLSLPVLTSC